jgi:hypothetical protein
VAELPPACQQWLADHHGVITTGVLRDHHVGRETLYRLLDARVLRCEAKGVYITTSTPRTVLQRCAVLSAAHRGGFVTGPTAGAILGLRRMPPTSELHFSVRHGNRLPPRVGVHYRQSTSIRPSDRVARLDGITIASGARLAFDLAADLRQLDHLSVIEQLLHQRMVTTDQLVAIERRLGHPARPGSGVFLRTLRSLGGARPSQSHPEVVVLEALRRRGVPVERQVAVVLGNGSRLHVDLGVEAARWGVELDIHPEHRSVDGSANDARRRRQLHLRAWQVETVTEPDLADMDALVVHLVELYRARCLELDADPRVS